MFLRAISATWQPAEMSRGTASSEFKAFAMRLRAIREACGFEDAASFARALGVEPPAYRKWERGQSGPSIAQLVKIQQVTSCSLDFLIAGTVPGFTNVHHLKPRHAG